MKSSSFRALTHSIRHNGSERFLEYLNGQSKRSNPDECLVLANQVINALEGRFKRVRSYIKMAVASHKFAIHIVVYGSIEIVISHDKKEISLAHKHFAPRVVIGSFQDMDEFTSEFNNKFCFSDKDEFLGFRLDNRSVSFKKKLVEYLALFNGDRAVMLDIVYKLKGKFSILTDKFIVIFHAEQLTIILEQDKRVATVQAKEGEIKQFKLWGIEQSIIKDYH